MLCRAAGTGPPPLSIRIIMNRVLNGQIVGVDSTAYKSGPIGKW